VYATCVLPVCSTREMAGGGTTLLRAARSGCAPDGKIWQLLGDAAANPNAACVIHWNGEAQGAAVATAQCDTHYLATAADWKMTAGLEAN